MGGQGHGHGHGHEELDESDVTPDDTYDTTGTVDELTPEQVDELHLAGIEEDVDAVLASTPDPEAQDSTDG